MGLEQHPHPAVNICPSSWCYRDGRISHGAACKLGTGQDSCCLLPVPSSQHLRQRCPVLGVHRPSSAGVRDCEGVLSSVILWNRDYQCQRCIAILLDSFTIPNLLPLWRRLCTPDTAAGLTAVVQLAHFAKGWREIDWEELSHCADDTDWMEWEWHGVNWTEQNRIYF